MWLRLNISNTISVFNRFQCALKGGWRENNPSFFLSQHFKLLVEELHVKGEAKIKNAMKESFKILNEVRGCLGWLCSWKVEVRFWLCCPTVCLQARVNGQGSMCNQAIMLITDGAMEDFESVFEEFNWPERRVRIRAVLHISVWSFMFCLVALFVFLWVQSSISSWTFDKSFGLL